MGQWKEHGARVRKREASPSLTHLGYPGLGTFSHLEIVLEPGSGGENKGTSYPLILQSPIFTNSTIEE